MLIIPFILSESIETIMIAARKEMRNESMMIDMSMWLFLSRARYHINIPQMIASNINI